jgi:ABC-type polar amino acid transport system ATPase subunit
MLGFFGKKESIATNGKHENVLADSLSAVTSAKILRAASRCRRCFDPGRTGRSRRAFGRERRGKNDDFLYDGRAGTRRKGKYFFERRRSDAACRCICGRVSDSVICRRKPSIFRRMTAEQNILAVLETMKMKRAERFARLEELLEEFGIAHVRRTRGDALSGGERRRVEIARCLATEPRFILLDEPFAGIDPIAIDDIREIILYLKNQGIGILITDHNVRETLGITDRAYIMAEGKILRAGAPQKLVEDAEVRRLYLGERFSL